MRLSPSRRRVAWTAGLGVSPARPKVRVELEGGQTRELSEAGQNPHWLNEQTVLYTSQTGRMMQAHEADNWRALDIGLGGNWLSASTGRWAAARTDPVRLFRNFGPDIPGAASPALSEAGQLAYLRYADGTLLVEDHDSPLGVAALPRWGDGVLAWEDMTGGLRMATTRTFIPGRRLYKPVPVRLLVGVCLLCHDQQGAILIVQAGTTFGMVLGQSDGSAYQHDAGWIDGALRTCWYRPDGSLQDTRTAAFVWTDLTTVQETPTPHGQPVLVPKHLGYYFDHGRYGEHNPACTMTVLGAGMYEDGDGHRPANVGDLMRQAAETAGSIFLGASDIDLLKASWRLVHAVWLGEVATPAEMRDEAVRARLEMNRLRLPHRPVVATLMPHQAADRAYRGVADAVAPEIYFEQPANGWEAQIQQVRERILSILAVHAPTPVYLIVQAFDRRPKYPGWAQQPAMLEAIQAACQEALADAQVSGLWWFAYARPGGVLAYPKLEQWHTAQVAVTPVPTLPNDPIDPEEPMPDIAQIKQNVATAVPRDIALGALSRFRNEVVWPRDQIPAPYTDQVTGGAAAIYFWPHYYAAISPHLVDGVPTGSAEEINRIWSTWSGEGLARAADAYWREQGNPHQGGSGGGGVQPPTGQGIKGPLGVQNRDVVTP